MAMLRHSRPGARPARRHPLALLVLAACLLPGAVLADTLTEPEAISRALQRPPVQAMANARVAAAQGAVSEAGRWPNPVVSVAQEEVDEPGGTATERVYQISQSFDFSGRRQLGRQAAGLRLESARAGSQAGQQGIVQEARQAFADLLYQQRRVEALRQWQERLRQSADVVTRLARAGEAAGFDRRRLQLELHQAISRHEQARADLVASQHRLAGLTGVDNALTLSATGDLLPAATPPAPGLQAQLPQRADLKALAAEAEAVALDSRAAGREWLPDLTVGVGRKQVDTPTGSGDGLALSVSMPIPLLNQGGARRSRLAAEADTLRAERELRHQEAAAQLQGQWQQLERLREEALRFRRDALQNAQELSRIAATAYRAGEVGVLELLDAYRSELSASQDALDLEHRAQRARIELDALAGVAP